MGLRAELTKAVQQVLLGPISLPWKGAVHSKKEQHPAREEQRRKQEQARPLHPSSSVNVANLVNLESFLMV